ncbi:MAG TPA: hypothetical protein VGH56_07870 [Solirubrobacteraceae bacterium]
MMTVLLTDEFNSACLIARRSSRRERLLTRIRATSLDTAIANGACPDSTAALSLRANRLIGRASRQRVARSIHRLLRDARCPPRRMHESVPICWRKVVRCRQLLEELADRLSGPGPVDAMGVAQLARLLTDGSSPLFGYPQHDDLRPALEAALEALEPSL